MKSRFYKTFNTLLYQYTIYRKQSYKLYTAFTIYSLVIQKLILSIGSLLAVSVYQTLSIIAINN